MQETLQNNTKKEGTGALDLKMFINGEWVNSTSGEKRDVLNPATGDVIAKAAEGTQEDVDAAVEAAKYAFYEGGWWGTPAVERARILFKIADKIEEKAEELAALETLDNGKPLREARYDIDDSAACFRYYAGLATKPTGQTYEVPDGQQAMVVREPIGVCGQIVPWNFPLMMSAWKLAPALAAGNSVVFKPSEVTPVTAVKLFEIMDEVGLPKGVANLVLGAGPVVGQAIAEHEEIDKVAFTGGTATGRKIMEASLGNLKKVTLELGGKSPNIVFADLTWGHSDYAYTGFSVIKDKCTQQAPVYYWKSPFYDCCKSYCEAKKIKVGSGSDENSQMGPIVSAHTKYTIYPNLNQSPPTIFVDTTPDMRIVQEEIFGPVLVVQKFKDEAEALRLANDTKYGLAGAVFTNDIAKAYRVIKKVRAGITWINSYHPTYNEAPWGGFKQSGNGRELGTFGYEAYDETSNIWISSQQVV
jgi:betaine-aldehyde dehydrogenase